MLAIGNLPLHGGRIRGVREYSIRAPFYALLLILQDPGRQGDCRGAQEWCESHNALHSRPLPSRNHHCLLADLAIRGTLHSVDQFLNIKLLNVSVEDAENFPHMVGNLTPSQTGLYVG